MRGGGGLDTLGLAWACSCLPEPDCNGDLTLAGPDSLSLFLSHSLPSLPPFSPSLSHSLPLSVTLYLPSCSTTETIGTFQSFEIYFLDKFKVEMCFLCFNTNFIYYICTVYYVFIFYSCCLQRIVCFVQYTPKIVEFKAEILSRHLHKIGFFSP